MPVLCMDMMMLFSLYLIARTIIILSIVYAIGNIVLSLSAMPPVLNDNETAYKLVLPHVSLAY